MLNYEKNKAKFDPNLTGRLEELLKADNAIMLGAGIEQEDPGYIFWHQETRKEPLTLIFPNNVFDFINNAANKYGFVLNTKEFYTDNQIMAAQYKKVDNASEMIKPL